MDLDRIGRYEIVELLSHGDDVIVYLAHDPHNNRQVEVKKFRVALDDTTRQRLVHGAQATCLLNHPNIATTYEVGEVNNAPFFAVEHLQGMTLQQLVSSGNRFDVQRAEHLTTTLAAALEHAHRQGVAHLDLKPARIMITAEGGVKITDFGMGLVFAKEVHPYRPPEQLQGAQGDARSDIYSLGAVAYACVTGRPPFTAPSPADLTREIIGQAAPDPRTLCPEVGVSLGSCLMKCLAKDPAQRFQTCGALVASMTSSEAALQPATPSRAAPVVEDDLDATILPSGKREKPQHAQKGLLSFPESNRHVMLKWGTELLIGREAFCDICCDEKRVSRRHGIVNLSYDGARFMDLASANGCTRNGAPVEGTIILNDGDRLGIGSAFELDVTVREHDDDVETVTFGKASYRYLLTQTAVLLGSDSSQADILIPDQAVADVHAKIELVFDTVLITGMVADTPLLVDDKPTMSGQLADGTRVQIGTTLMVWNTVE